MWKTIFSILTAVLFVQFRMRHTVGESLEENFKQDHSLFPNNFSSTLRIDEYVRPNSNFPLLYAINYLVFWYFLYCYCYCSYKYYYITYVYIKNMFLRNIIALLPSPLVFSLCINSTCVCVCVLGMCICMCLWCHLIFARMAIKANFYLY